MLPGRSPMPADGYGNSAWARLWRQVCYRAKCGGARICGVVATEEWAHDWTGWGLPRVGGGFISCGRGLGFRHARHAAAMVGGWVDPSATSVGAVPTLGSRCNRGRESDGGTSARSMTARPLGAATTWSRCGRGEAGWRGGPAQQAQSGQRARWPHGWAAREVRGIWAEMVSLGPAVGLPFFFLYFILFSLFQI
jgi:hypothetical protein